MKTKMGLFDREDKPDRYVERLENEIEYLRNQVAKLQEALFSVSAPEGYRQMKQDEAQMRVEKEISPEQKKEAEWERSFYSRLAEETEKPLFESMEDLEAILARGTRGNLVPATIDPSNPES